MFAALQKLEDDCLVYYEPLIQQRYPDFVVVLQDVGVLIIEVKGWYPAEIKRGDGHEVLVNAKGRDTVEQHPTRQARDYMHRLRDACRGHTFAGTLLQATGPRAGAFTFPFGHIAVLSNVTREQLHDPARPGLAAVFSQANIVTRDELTAWQDLDGNALKAELVRHFDPFWPIEKMTQQQIDVLRSVIHPEVNISAVMPAAHGNAPTPVDLKVLDYRQERNARSIGDGHRIIYGVAGSGKTVLLVARAKMVAEDAEKRILVLCFNKVLARYLKATLTENLNVEVVHFHAWGAKNGIRFDDDAEKYGERFLQVLARGEGDARRYDAILVDEAQDFACSWFRCAKEALKEPDDGDLVIVGDGSQSLYRSRPFTWKDAGINAVGRVINQKFDLDRNYRNTAEILAAAHSFAGKATADNDDAAVRGMEVSPKRALRQGPWPKVILAESRESEVNAVLGLVRQWVAEGFETANGRSTISANDIGILYPRLRRRDRVVMERLCAKLAEFKVVRLSGEEATGSPADNGIKISTIHSAKGLQFRAVILMWTDLLPSELDDRNEDSERRQVYVALTRAEEVLAVTHSGPSIYVDEIKKNIAAAVA